MTKTLNIGDMAPDFTLPTQDGFFSLNQNRGKKVVLYFYPKDLTSGCTAQAIDFNGKRAAFEVKNAVIIGVSADSVKSHANFCNKYDLKFSLVSDEDKKVLESYGVWVEKSMYGRKYMGIERTTYVIDESGKIANIFNKVKVPGHVDAVLKTL